MGQTAKFAAGSWIVRQAAIVLFVHGRQERTGSLFSFQQPGKSFSESLLEVIRSGIA
jgi:hypothetical protein